MTQLSAHDREVLHALVRRPATLVAAVNRDGFRVPVPLWWQVPPENIIATPSEWATMLDLVAPADALSVVAAFTRSRADGAADVVVHIRSEPDRPVVLGFDAVCGGGDLIVAALTPVQGDDQPLAAVAAPQAQALRPLTGWIRRTRTAQVIDADERACLLLGRTREDIVAVESSTILHPDDSTVAVSGWMAMLATGRPSRMRVRYRCVRPHGDTWVWMEIDSEIVDGEDGTPEVRSQLRDISEEMAVLDELTRRERMFRRLAEALPLGLLHLDASGVAEYANEHAGVLLGVEPPPHGATALADWLAGVTPAGQVAVEEAVLAVRHGGATHVVEVSVPVAGGGVRRCQVSVISLADTAASADTASTDTGSLVLVQDVTAQATLHDELQGQATFDALTGCHNRASTIGLLNEMLATEAPGRVAVIFADLDRLKPINDTYGHAAGDELLISAAQRLRQMVRAGDVVGRLGGDEFLVVLRGIDDEQEATWIGDRVTAALSGTVQLSSALVALSASTGFVRSEAGDTAASLVARADAAMYAAKSTAKAARS